jgi:hypothetical protein
VDVKLVVDPSQVALDRFLTGRARIVWDAEAVRSRPGAERLVQIAVDAVHEHEQAMPARWSLIEPYQRNPAVNP